MQRRRRIVAVCPRFYIKHLNIAIPFINCHLDYEFRQGLSPIAKKACAIVSQIRDEERRTIWKTEGNPELNESEVFPGMMFNVAKSHMETTKLWGIVRKMPKGSVLHAHIGATVDLKWVFNEAIETPGMCFSAAAALTSTIVRERSSLKFQHDSSITATASSIWSADYAPNVLIPLKECAESFPDGGRAGFITWMENRCSITQTESLQHHLGVDDVWRKLSSAFIILSPIFYYEPIFRTFVRKLFSTLLEDGIRWIEIRAVVNSAFTFTGRNTAEYKPLEIARILDEVITEFMASDEGKEFWGARIIWTSMRHTSTKVIIEGK